MALKVRRENNSSLWREEGRPLPFTRASCNYVAHAEQRAVHLGKILMELEHWGPPAEARRQKSLGMRKGDPQGGEWSPKARQIRGGSRKWVTQTGGLDCHGVCPQWTMNE